MRQNQNEGFYVGSSPPAGPGDRLQTEDGVETEETVRHHDETVTITDRTWLSADQSLRVAALRSALKPTLR